MLGNLNGVSVPRFLMYVLLMCRMVCGFMMKSEFSDLAKDV